MTATSNTRKPYSGTNRALVLALDIGTTFSGVSYAILEPGEVPKIHGVTRFPGQEHVAGNSKVPSIIFYDNEGNVKAAGAEADSTQIASQAEDEGWMKVELFKLRLRPKTMKLDMNGMKLSSLPKSKSSGDVFGDFLRYLFQCTKRFIEDTHANGIVLWKAVEKDIHIVLSHPNGWEGAQQSKMRRSAISGGLIPNTDEGKSRIRFVTEGEASLHACVLNGLAADVLSKHTGSGFIVADAGGGTLDISSYAIKGTSPLIIEEIAPADCVFAGAVFVSRRARVFLEEKLKFSKYGTPDALDHITKRFDETTKRLFRDKNEPQFIPFGSPLDKDLKVGIRGGQLKLTGAEVAELFEPSIEAAVVSIKAQIEASAGTVKAVWLVGGFAANPWLFTQLQERLAALKVTVNRPDTQTSKAVADGAIGFFCDHHVSARMSKYMYGVEYLREVNMEDQEHVTRQGRLLQLPSGPKLLPDAFDCILAKNVRVKESSVFSRKYYTEVTKLSTLSLFEVEIWCFRGGEEIPKWIVRDSDQFGSLCFVQADLSKLSDSAQSKVGTNGQTYWTIVFSIEIHFGLTEFKAWMKWNDNGKSRYGPATIVYNERGSRTEEDDNSILADDEPQGRDKRHDKHRSAPASRARSKERSDGSAHRQSRGEGASSDAVKSDSGDRSSKRRSKGKEKETASVPASPADEGQPSTVNQDHGKSSGEGKRSRAASIRSTLSGIFSRGGDKKETSNPSTPSESAGEFLAPAGSAETTQQTTLSEEAPRSAQADESSKDADPAPSEATDSKADSPQENGASAGPNDKVTSDSLNDLVAAPAETIVQSPEDSKEANGVVAEKASSVAAQQPSSSAHLPVAENNDDSGKSSKGGKKSGKKSKKSQAGSNVGSDVGGESKSEKANEGGAEEKGEGMSKKVEDPNVSALDNVSGLDAMMEVAPALAPPTGMTDKDVPVVNDTPQSAAVPSDHAASLDCILPPSTQTGGPDGSVHTPAESKEAESAGVIPESSTAPPPTNSTGEQKTETGPADEPKPDDITAVAPEKTESVVGLNTLGSATPAMDAPASAISAAGSSWFLPSPLEPPVVSSTASSPKATSTAVLGETTSDGPAASTPNPLDKATDVEDDATTKPPSSSAAGSAKLKKLPKPPRGPKKGKGKGKATETDGDAGTTGASKNPPEDVDQTNGGKGTNDEFDVNSGAKEEENPVEDMWGATGGGWGSGGAAEGSWDLMGDV